MTGNIIDNHIVNMQRGQTNGIPQGSVLMDFVAEILLGYADTQLTRKIDCQGITDYEILRYRDDYRIFVNSTQEGDRILKCLTEVLMDLGLQLNSAKTILSSDVVQSSIKKEKLNWIYQKQDERNLQKHLLIVHNHSQRFPNAGSLEAGLREFHERVYKRKRHPDSPLPLIAIATDIMYRSPRTYPISGAILSKLIDFLGSQCEKQTTAERILRKFANVPNTAYMEIWLQRVSHKFAPNMQYKESLCKLVCLHEVSLWNNDWMDSIDLRAACDPKKIFDAEILRNLDDVVPPEEVKTWSGYS